MADPTLRILATLDDPERYVRVSGVPVFVPHVRRDGDGNVEAAVSLEDLQEIAEGINRKVEEFGALVRITRGHVVLAKPDEQPPPEDEQPPIWGWGKFARVGTWGPEKKPGLLIDAYFRKEHHAEAMTYPFRSAEYYPDTNEITGIALLRRDPELDLGILTYARRDLPAQVEPAEEADMPMEEDLDELLGEAEGEQEQYADEPLGEPDGDEFSPEEAEQYARMFRYAAQHAEDVLSGMAEDDEDRPGVEQLARCYGRLAYGGEPAGGNTFVPGDDDMDEPPMEPIGDELDEMEQYGSDGLRGQNQEGQMRAIGAKTDAKKKEKKAKKDEVNKRVAQAPYGRRSQPSHYGRQLQEVQSQLQEVQRDRELLRYERQLMALQARGLDIDIEAEVEHAQDMTPEQRQRQLKMIVRHYGRSVTGGSLISTDVDDVERGLQRPLTARQRQLAQQYAQKHKCTWEQAMAWARKQ